MQLIRSTLLLLFLLACANKKEPESLIKKRPEIISEEELEGLPESTQP
tara:strand:+ start:292 stop:435 length:144 start_codon:yes stop_codon:yes gene_type:complete